MMIDTGRFVSDSHRIFFSNDSISFSVAGAFIRSNGLGSRKNMPKVNLLSAAEEADAYWQPRLQRSWRNVIQAHFVNETVFVHGLFSPFHFSHWLYNGMLPLYR